jgi:hypothetical protein
MNRRLCRSFLQLSEQTWDNMEAAWRTGLAWSEETNTESLLLALCRLHPTEVKIAAFSKKQEAYIGADWEFWIGTNGAWIGMRVQAKRITISNLAFKGLQTYRAKKAPQTQIDTLISRSRNDRLNPVYCLYTCIPHISGPISFFSHCVSGVFSTEYGCTIGHAQALRRIGSEKLPALWPALFPWHVLVCGCRSGDAAASAAAGIFNFLSASLSGASPKSGAGVTGIIDDSSPVIFEPQAELPQHMRFLRDLPYREEPLELERLEELVRAKDRGIGGIALIDTERSR